MAKKRFCPEQIITYLRQEEYLVSQGKMAGEACRQIDVAEQSCFR